MPYTEPYISTAIHRSMQHVLNNVFFALGDNGCFIQVFLGVNMSFSKENNLILIRVIYEHNIINTEQDRTECGYKVNLFLFYWMLGTVWCDIVGYSELVIGAGGADTLVFP